MYEEELKIAKSLALDAGTIMLEYFDSEQGLEHKPDTSDASEVTIADKKINSMVINELSKKFTYGVIGEEESNSEYGTGMKWFCDPIDGTRAFVIGVPTAMFSLGLVVDGEPVLGVLYDPFLEKMYWGIKGQGSYCNGVRLAVSKNPLKGQYVELSGSLEKLVESPETIKKLIDFGARPNAIYGGVYKTSLIARGRIAGYFDKYLNPHDIAAGQVVLEEAGGKVTGYDGNQLDYTKNFRGAVLSNGVVHEQLLECARA